MRSVKTRTRSPWPRVNRSWALSAPARARIFSAATTGSSSTPWVRASSTRRARFRVLPDLRTTAKRLGARSGKTMVIFNNTASGSARRARRSVASITTVGTTSTVAHHPANQGAVRGLGRRCAVTVAATMDNVTGTTKTAPLTSPDSTGRPCHRSSALSPLGFLRVITILNVPRSPMCGYESVDVRELSSACASWR